MQTAEKKTRWRLGQRGVAALEFALIAPTFLLLTFIIFDNALEMFQQAGIDYALRSAARPLLTGSATVTSASFSSAACQAVSPLIGGTGGCANLSFYVQTATATAGFAGLTPQTPNSSGVYTGCTYTQAQNGSCTAANFQASGPTSLVLAQVAYVRPYVFGWLESQFSPTGTPSIVSTMAFKAEAY